MWTGVRIRYSGGGGDGCAWLEVAVVVVPEGRGVGCRVPVSGVMRVFVGIG